MERLCGGTAILSMRNIIIRISRAVLAIVVCASTVVAHAEVFPVAASIRAMDAPREVVHTLEALKSGARLGEQSSRLITEGDRLRFKVVTRFEDGVVSDERGVMDISNGYRALSFSKVGRKNGVVLDEHHIDFVTGHTEWMIDGEHHEQNFSFAPDTYAGPMLAVVLAAVPQMPGGQAFFEMITFRPDPSVYTIRVDVVDRGTFNLVSTPSPATKLRLKVDLGSVGNALFKRIIPTHYFWYTQDASPDFFAFEGQLGHDGPELLMFPQGLQRRAVPGDGTVVAQH